MSSNLKVNTILPSAGSNIGLVTNGGNLNVDGGCKVQVGTALTLDFNQGVDVQFSGGIATITSQAATWQGNQSGTFTLGSVGIGTTNTQSVAGVALTSQLTVGIVSCYEIYQDSKRLALESNVIAYAVALGG